MSDARKAPNTEGSPQAPIKPESAAEDSTTERDQLDEALVETFPASDPISPAQTTRVDRAKTSGKDA